MSRLVLKSAAEVAIMDEANRILRRINDELYSNAGDGFVAKIALVLLEAAGTPSPGSRIDFTMTATSAERNGQQERREA